MSQVFMKIKGFISAINVVIVIRAELDYFVTRKEKGKISVLENLEIQEKLFTLVKISEIQNAYILIVLIKTFQDLHMLVS